MPDYVVTFDRIGRNHQPPTLTTTATGVPDLADKISDHARPHLASRDISAIMDDRGNGTVLAGFRNAGGFTVIPPPVPDVIPGSQPEIVGPPVTVKWDRSYSLTSNDNGDLVITWDGRTFDTGKMRAIEADRDQLSAQVEGYRQRLRSTEARLDDARKLHTRYHDEDTDTARCRHCITGCDSNVGEPVHAMWPCATHTALKGPPF